MNFETREEWLQSLQFQERSLEDLAIAVIGLKDREQCPLPIRLEDVLQPWILRQFPPPVMRG